MACIIKFTVQDKTWEIESNYLSPGVTILSAEFVRALNNNPIIRDESGNISSWNEIKDYIVDLEGKNRNGYRQINAKTLASKGLMANCDAEFLKSRYPEIDFGSAKTQGVEILLVDNLRFDTKYPYGHVHFYKINDNGEEIEKELFIIKDSEYSVMNFANYLKLSTLIDSLDELQNLESEENKELNAILIEYNKGRKLNKISDIKQLLKEFILNKPNFVGLSVNGKYATVTLSNFLKDLQNFDQSIIYENEFINGLHSVRKYAKIKNERKMYIQTEDFLAMAIDVYKEDLSKIVDLSLSKSKLVTEFMQIMSEKAIDHESELKEIFGDEFPIINDNTLVADVLLARWIFSKESTLNYKFGKIDKRNKRIIFDPDIKDLGSRYGITYDHIANFEYLQENIHGYKIYVRINDETGEKEYIPSKHYLTEKTFTKPFKTKEEAIQWIEEKRMKEKTAAAGLLSLKYRLFDEEHNPLTTEIDDTDVDLLIKIPEGTMIDSIDIPLDANVKIENGLENQFINGTATYEDFVNFIKSDFLIIGDDFAGFIDSLSGDLRQYILDNIDNAEKAAIFIYKLNQDLGPMTIENRKNKHREIKAIVDEIVEASKNPKQYYIHKQGPISTKTGTMIGYAFKTRVIPTTNVEVEYRKNKRQPVITQLLAILQVFDNKFGVKVNLLTSEEIISNDRYRGINPNETKAFILNGEVNINMDIASTEDAMHEYTHLLLGVLKSNPETRNHYLELLGMILKTREGKSKLDELRAKRPDIYSEIDLAEEVFADLFGEYISKNLHHLSKEVTDVFVKDDRTLEKEIKSIFELPANKSLSSLYKQSFISIMMTFSRDVRELLANDSGFSFSSTGESRKISKYIEDLIEKGNIKEHDCE